MTPRTYTFSECCRILDVDAKTFGRWLEKASIDPKKQVSKVDNRIRFLTQPQLEQLATDHGRTLTPQTEQIATESVPPGAYKLLQERLDGLENTVGELGDDISSTRTEIYTSTPSRSELADLHALLTSALERITTLEEQLTQAQETIATLQAPKRATKAKSASVESINPEDILPEGLIPWRPFADQHRIGHTTIHRHISNGIVHTVKGKWKIGNGYVKDLLDAQGRRDIWIQCHTNENFVPCDECPHEIEVGTRRERGGNETGIEQERGGNETGTEQQAAL